ncbi:sirohydrochlorin chelatase [Streptomyces pluripotens]|uniref:Sirohydrochlorin chelatase n=1 Tax=Streptomyces pluripotens TaxID=1355015 RepID=A0A221NX46_9ACTN|nr:MULTISPECIES: sirohydrochlorin chelatase [Streptomyces]ARP70109.1 sirohydrochlorin chelatase [Streptomyces pluripotens]ASN24368.1 sirohydrochlorin chelatase [Streptomyces pluripotens]KIE23433.1 sirohydrochlorin cobaltochelatase [Streptomyces sp. MUSC 125]MCH0559096.1 sirohydrochlorin chelatase [Streptomyces sp. MUM 16J]
MTASHPPPSEPDIRLDSTAHLLNSIGSRLADRLRLVSPIGRRHPAPPTLVLVAHGSRDPRALATVRALMARLRALRPTLPVRLGHIELTEPLLPDTLAALGDTPAVCVPLLLGRGHHVRRDIPEAVAATSVNARVAAPLGPHPLLAETLYDRLIEAGWPQDEAEPGRRGAAAVVLAAAGSRDPDSATDTRRTARLLAGRLNVPVIPAYASAAAPTVPAALRALAARGRHRVAIASYFTAPGRFATQCADQSPWLASAPLGVHPAMARLILHRYDQSLAAPRTEAA